MAFSALIARLITGRKLFHERPRIKHLFERLKVAFDFSHVADFSRSCRRTDARALIGAIVPLVMLTTVTAFRPSSSQ